MEPSAVIFKGSGALKEFQNQPTEELTEGGRLVQRCLLVYISCDIVSGPEGNQVYRMCSVCITETDAAAKTCTKEGQ
jgi:hypothetical protein